MIDPDYNPYENNKLPIIGIYTNKRKEITIQEQQKEEE